LSVYTESTSLLKLSYFFFYFLNRLKEENKSILQKLKSRKRREKLNSR